MSTVVRVGARGHRGPTLVITRSDRAEHVLDALFDDIALAGLTRVELTHEGITLTFAKGPPEDVVRKQVIALLGPPRWTIVDQE